MIEEEIEKALDEIFKEDTQTIRESMKSLIRSYDNALGELVESDKKINELQKENEKLKEENIKLEGNKIGCKLAIQELRKENEEKDKIKIVKKGENAYDVWGIPGTSSYENYKEAAKKVSKHIEKLQKENQELKEENKKISKAADKMYEYISYYGWEDFESNTGCNREEMVDYFYKE